MRSNREARWHMKVFEVTVRASFYVLAVDSPDALETVERMHPIAELAAGLPTGACPLYAVHEIRAQDHYHRQRCINYVFDIGTKP